MAHRPGRIAPRHGPGKVHARDLDRRWPRMASATPGARPHCALPGIIQALEDSTAFIVISGVSREISRPSWGAPLRPAQALIFCGRYH